MYGDLDRPPLRADALAHALEPDGWQVQVVEQATSTQDLARGGAAGPGRGRRGADRGTRAARPQLGLAAAGRAHLQRRRPAGAGRRLGAAARRPGGRQRGARAVRARRRTEVAERRAGRRARRCAACWPRSAATRSSSGIGLNVTTRADELPHDQATSLQLAGATVTDRETLLKAVLRELAACIARQPLASYRQQVQHAGTAGAAGRCPAATSITRYGGDGRRAGRLVVDGGRVCGGRRGPS